MSIPRKIIFSLLISVVVFVFFAAAAFTGLFDLVETRFYNPRILRGLNREIEEDARVIGALLDELRDRFIIVAGEEAVRRSFLSGQTEEDTFDRSRIFGSLLNSLPALRSVRFVDAGGSRIRFSTLAEDVLYQDGGSPAYRSYPDCPGVLPYAEVEAPEGAAPRLIFDGRGEQIIFSYPFTDTLEVYWGSALFTFSVRAVAERMVQEGRIQVGEDVSVVSSPGGFLLGLPAADKESLKSQAAAVWGKGILGLSILDEENSDSLALISAEYGGEDSGRRKNLTGKQLHRPKSGTVFTGRLVREELFIFPPFMKIVLLASLFLTLFLLVFLLFNLRQDSIRVIKSRLKRLRNGLFRQYHEQKALDGKHWARELEQRRGEVRAELKRDLPGRKKNSPVQAKIDALIDLSWDEVVAAIGKYPPANLDEEQLRAIIADVLRHSAGLPPEGPTPAAGPAGIGGSNPETEAEELEELEVVEEPAGDTWELTEDKKRAELSTVLVDAEDAEVLEELGESEEQERNENKSSGEIVVTPEIFKAELEADLEPLEDDPAPMTAENLDILASQIEFGPEEEAGEEENEGEVLHLDLSSPFNSLSFESPSFSGGGEKETGFSAGDKKPDFNESPGERKKKRQTDETLKDSSLMEITGDGGLPFIYKPFLFRENSKPLPLRPLEDQAPEAIRERNGLHQINSDILDPKLETLDNLDPKFLRLVKSIISKEA
ncbi:MAG: hypothetical protein LBG07_03145 [Treponema sp.]|jgi:hypothetical protein|nr:hypothetical protein [Treponema sp.]